MESIKKKILTEIWDTVFCVITSPDCVSCTVFQHLMETVRIPLRLPVNGYTNQILEQLEEDIENGKY